MGAFHHGSHGVEAKGIWTKCVRVCRHDIANGCVERAPRRHHSIGQIARCQDANELFIFRHQNAGNPPICHNFCCFCHRGIGRNGDGVWCHQFADGDGNQIGGLIHALRFGAFLGNGAVKETMKSGILLDEAIEFGLWNEEQNRVFCRDCFVWRFAIGKKRTFAKAIADIEMEQQIVFRRDQIHSTGMQQIKAGHTLTNVGNRVACLDLNA